MKVTYIDKHGIAITFNSHSQADKVLKNKCPNWRKKARTIHKSPVPLIVQECSDEVYEKQLLHQLKYV